MTPVSLFVRLACALCILTLADDPIPSDNQSPSEAASSEFPASDPTVLDPRWLDDVKHPQTGLLSRNIRPEEAAGYFAILNHARQLSQRQLKDSARWLETERRGVVKGDPNYRFYFRKPDAEFPTFVDLYRAPEVYHGKLVTFRGHILRLVSFPAGENAHGLQQLHEAWLYVGEAQQNPVVVVCSELPPGIPTGSDIVVDFVSATGYFFKRYGYEDRTGQPRFAPLILAQRLEWTPPAKHAALLSKSAIFWLSVGVAAVIAVVWWRTSRHDLTVLQRSLETAPGDADDNPFSTEPTPQV